MILPVLDNIALYLNTNLKGYFKSTWTNVQLLQKKSEEGDQVFPGAWEEGSAEPLPLINDKDTPYCYFRITGPVTSGPEILYTSCKYTYNDTYPVRLVVHVREKREDQGHALAGLMRQLLGQYKWTRPSGSGIDRVILEITATETDKNAVLSDETSGGNWTPLDIDTIIAVDFDLTLRYTPGDCIEENPLCITISTVTQV